MTTFDHFRDMDAGELSDYIRYQTNRIKMLIFDRNDAAERVDHYRQQIIDFGMYSKLTLREYRILWSRSKRLFEQLDDQVGQARALLRDAENESYRKSSTYWHRKTRGW